MFVEGVRAEGIEPHPTLHKDRSAMVVIRTLALTVSQKCRRKMEEIFGWAKTTGCFRKIRCSGTERTPAEGQYVATASTLVRVGLLMMTAPPASTLRTSRQSNAAAPKTAQIPSRRLSLYQILPN